MYEYLNENNLLAEEQFGFRKYHSTEYAAISLVDHISKEMELGKTPGAVSIDLSKAFDTLSFDITLYKLNYCGIAGTELQLLITYKIGNIMLFLIIMNLILLTLQRCPTGFYFGPFAVQYIYQCVEKNLVKN